MIPVHGVCIPVRSKRRGADASRFCPKSCTDGFAIGRLGRTLEAGRVDVLVNLTGAEEVVSMGACSYVGEWAVRGSGSVVGLHCVVSWTLFVMRVVRPIVYAVGVVGGMLCLCVWGSGSIRSR